LSPVGTAFAAPGEDTPPAVAVDGGGKSGQIPESATFSGLSDRWRTLMPEMGVPGMAVVVVENDRIIMQECLGIRDPQTKEPVTPNTLFFIAAGTKSLVAMTAAQLADQGKIDLDAPVKKYLPRFELANPDVASSHYNSRSLVSTLGHRELRDQLC
jgi:CubicO group peptidase (beta-lactamase class C family)